MLVVLRMPLRLAIVLLTLLHYACGTLLAVEKRTPVDRVFERQGGIERRDGRLYELSSTATFVPDGTVAVEGNVLRTDLCRQYARVGYRVETETQKIPAASGVAVDAGLLGAGLLAAVFADGAGAKTAIVLGAAVPLAVDGWRYFSRPVTASPALTRIEPEVPGAAGSYPCGQTDAGGVRLEFAGETTRVSGGRFAVRIPESRVSSSGGPILTAHARILAAEGPFELGPQSLALGVTLATYRALRSEAETTRSLTASARFVMAYPESASAAVMRQILVRELAHAPTEEELRAVLDLPQLPPELRKPAAARYMDLRVDRLRRSIPEVLLGIHRDDRDANTFLLNGFAEEGLAATQRRKDGLAALCAAVSELDLREEDRRDRNRREWHAELVSQVGEVDAATAMRYLGQCGK